MRPAITIEERLREIAQMNNFRHRFSHYNFEMEIHPEDDIIELQKDINDLHLD